MSNNGENATLESEKSFEDLFGHAPLRTTPSVEDTDTARAAVRVEWLAITHKRKHQRWIVSFAAAASVLAVLSLVVSLVNTHVVPPLKVASIDMSLGSIYILGEQSQLQSTGKLSAISAGQTIVTGNESGLGLNWIGGGSLRIDAASRVVFVSADSIELESGRVYFDSMNMASEFEVRTKHGVVTPLGTQYMTSVNAQSLTVSVREGRVSVDGLYYGDIAQERQRLTIHGNARPEFLNISAYGEDWHWIEATAPRKSFDGKTVLEFLEWVARETGLALEFTSPSVVRTIHTETLIGEVNAEPRIALRQRLPTVDLDYRIMNGVIYISEM